MRPFHFRLALTGVALVTAAIGYAQPTNAAADAPATAERLVKMHQAWGPAIDSPGASLSLVELSRHEKIVTYRLYAKGLPRDITYSLISWPVTSKEPVISLRGVTLDESGLAICAGKPGTCGSADNPNDPVDLATQPALGEPYRFGLISESKKLRAAVKIVPIPNIGNDKDCRIEAVLLTPAGELVEIEGSGFPPGSELEFESRSGKERHDGKVKAGADGRYVSALMPFVEGRTHGTTHVNLKAEKCNPELSFDWGRP